MNFELTEEQLMMWDMARKFAEQEMLPTLRDFERQRKINYDVIKKMGSLGLIGAHIPQEYGGAGLDYTSAAIIWERLSWASWTQTLISLGAGVLPGTIIMNAATELAVRASAEAIRLHGAYGCTDDFPVEHHYRDAVLSTIFGGTTEMHKLIIGRELLGINALI